MRVSIIGSAQTKSEQDGERARSRETEIVVAPLSPTEAWHEFSSDPPGFLKTTVLQSVHRMKSEPHNVTRVHTVHDANPGLSLG